MNKPAAIAAQVVDIQNDRQHKGFVKVTLHVPAELGAQLTESLGWPTYTTPVPIAIARLKQQQEETNTATEKPAPTQPPARAPRSPLVTRAAILSNDPLFWKYLGEKEGKLVGKDGAAMHIREWCKVESRKDILPGTEAALRLDLLQTDFVCWRDKDQFVEAS
jgi:hypothetical protein